MATPEQQLQEQQHHDELALLLLLYGRTREQLLRDGIYFIWDAGRHRYWNLSAESIVTPTQLRIYVDAAIQTTENRIEWLTRRLINGNIDFPTWATMVQTELKAENVGLARLAIGGGDMWDATAAGRLGARMRFLYGKLTDLGLEWERGEVSDAQMLNRIHMAVESGRGTFEGMVRGLMADIGVAEEMRVLGVAVHCADCPPISGYWAPIGSLPGIGDSACLCITTPQSRVLTARGLVPISEVRAGDMVMTHLGRLRPVTATPVRFASGKRHVFMRGTNWLGCTADHRWLTPAGWQQIGDIAGSVLPVYNWQYAKALSELWLSNSNTESSGTLQVLPTGMFLRPEEGSPSARMPALFQQKDSPSSMGRPLDRCPNAHCIKGERSGATAAMARSDNEVVLSDQNRGWAAIRNILGRRDRTLANDLPLSVGLDSGEWSDPAWSRDTSQEPRLHGRQARKSGPTAEHRTPEIARSSKSARTSNMDLRTLWREFQSVPSSPTTYPAILFAGLLPRTTPLYDLTVEEDHSFIIEGLVAHNSNCACSFVYKMPDGTETEGE